MTYNFHPQLHLGLAAGLALAALTSVFLPASGAHVSPAVSGNKIDFIWLCCRHFLFIWDCCLSRCAWQQPSFTASHHCEQLPWQSHSVVAQLPRPLSSLASRASPGTTFRGCRRPTPPSSSCSAFSPCSSSWEQGEGRAKVRTSSDQFRSIQNHLQA